MMIMVMTMILKKDIVTDDNPLLRKKSIDVSFPLSKEDEQIIHDLIEYLDLSQDEATAKNMICNQVWGLLRHK